MSKSKVLKAVKRIGGCLIDNSSPQYYDVEIESPAGCRWDDCHRRVVSWRACGNKSDFWREVLIEVDQLVAVKCCDSCEYW